MQFKGVRARTRVKKRIPGVYALALFVAVCESVGVIIELVQNPSTGQFVGNGKSASRKDPPGRS
jgi:hypothetical protein